MRAIFTLFLSLTLAVVICFVLISAGILELKDRETVAKLRLLGEEVLSRVTTAFDALPTNRGGASHPGSEKNPSGQISRPAIQDSATDHSGPATADRDSFIHNKALEFLRAHGKNNKANIEDSFAEYLVQEIGLSQNEAARLVRMSFWKNFLTLQQKWQAKDREKMRLAFYREKELKQAGFTAKGLPFIGSEIEEAGAHLQELQEPSATVSIGER
jgi:hypothetical protein